MNKILRYITLVGVFIIPFIPLVVTNSLFFPFITGKNFMFRIVVEIIFAAWVVLAVTDTAYRPRKSWILYGFAAFVAVIALADAFGMYPFKSFWSNYERMEGWVTLAHLLAYFVVTATVLAKEKLWDALFQTSLGVNAVILLYSMLQIGKFVTINQGGVRADATFGNATYLAIYAVFNIFIAAVYLVRRSERFHVFKNWMFALGFNVGFFLFILPLLGNATLQSADSSATYLWAFLAWIVVNLIFYITALIKQEKIVFGALIIFNLIALYNTATRGALIGLIGGVLSATLLVLIFSRSTKERKVAIGIMMAVVLVVLAFFAFKDTQFVKDSPVLSRFASISLDEKTTLSRFKLWNMAVEGFTQRPILGWGQENFNYVFNQNYNPELYNQEQWFDRTHNVIFDWLIAGGILGLAAYLFFFGAVIYYIWRDRGEDGFSIVEKSILTGMMIAYFVHNLFVFDNVTSYIVFVTIAAYVYNRTSLRHAHESHRHVNQVILPVVAVALIVMLYAVNLRPILANQTLIKAISLSLQSTDITKNVESFERAINYGTFGNPEIREQLISLANQYTTIQQPVQGKEALLAYAKTQGEEQLKLTPSDARYQIFHGTYLARLGDTDAAIEHLLKAQALSPKKQTIIFALAGVYMTKNDYVNAEKWLRVAYELEPSYENARLTYAAAIIYNNDLPRAMKVLEGVSTSTIAASNDIIQAAYTAKQYKLLIDLWKFRVQENPSAQNHVSLAAAYLYANDRTNAILELQTAIKLEPSFKEQGEDYIKQIREGKNP
jgi:tetratricopeptide (TPR) repeat protein